MAISLRNLKQLCYEDGWKIENVEVPFVAKREISVYFGADEVVIGNDWAPLPPSRLQIETLVHIGTLPQNFIRKQTRTIRQYCQSVLESREFRVGNKIDLFRIENHFRVRELIIPFIKSARKHNFILICSCDWQDRQAMKIFCRDDKILKVGEGDMSW